MVGAMGRLVGGDGDVAAEGVAPEVAVAGAVGGFGGVEGVVVVFVILVFVVGGDAFEGGRRG